MLMKYQLDSLLDSQRLGSINIFLQALIVSTNMGTCQSRNGVSSSEVQEGEEVQKSNKKTVQEVKAQRVHNGQSNPKMTLRRVINEKIKSEQGRDPYSSQNSEKVRNSRAAMPKEQSRSIFFDKGDKDNFIDKCPSGNKAKLICTNPNCQNAVLCSRNACNSCQPSDHKECKTIQMDKMVNMLSQRVGKNQNFMVDLLKIDDQLAQTVGISRKKLEKLFYFGDMSREDRQLAEQIFLNKTTRRISGRQMSRFCSWLNTDNKNLEARKAYVMESFQLKTHKIMESVQQAKLSLQDCLTGEQDLKKEALFYSKVIPNRDFWQRMQMIEYLWKALKQPKKVEFLYRASEHDFSAQSFHKICDAIQNTLVLVTTQFGKTIAGFTHYRWDQIDEAWVQDPRRQSFLVQLDIKQKMLPIVDNKLIYCSKDCGPVFGGDLFISDGCNSNNDSFGNFPWTYNSEGASKYLKGSEDGRKIFTGASNGGYFKILEYEVFKVRY